MRVWLLGGRGMAGTALGRRLSDLEIPYVATGSEVDVGDPGALMVAAEQLSPSHVINCAAFTAVDACEDDVAQANRVNADGPANVAAVAAHRRLPALTISTDYVFDGDARAPYQETDPVAPRSVYGRSKLEGERRFLEGLAEASSNSYAVRTSWLFGHPGRSFVHTMLRLMAERDELRVVDDQHGCPTAAADLASAILQLLGLDGQGEPAPSGLYHFCNSEIVSWYGFALAIAETARDLGHDLRVRSILPAARADFPVAAPRPAYSAMSCRKLSAAVGTQPRSFRVPLRQVVAAILEMES